MFKNLGLYGAAGAVMQKKSVEGFMRTRKRAPKSITKAVETKAVPRNFPKCTAFTTRV